MTVLINRRKLIQGAGATALIAAFGQFPAFSLDLGSVFGTVLGAAGVGLFPGAAAALGGFELIKLLGNAADLAGNANNLVTQTQQLEAHFDSVLSQVSATLATVQSFVNDCDNALHNIENLIKQLPGTLAAAFNELAAKTAFARLRGDSANMAAYLHSKGSIIANHTQIQNLSEKIVNDISAVDALQQNTFQAVMQVVPALTTWVQGYTAYNLLFTGDTRGINPWDHQVVSAIGLPRITALVDGIKQQRQAAGNIDSYLPLDAGALYTFDGASFSKTNKIFAQQYQPGNIDNGFYFTIYPDGLTQSTIPGVTPEQGDFCYLSNSAYGRFWFPVIVPTTGVFAPYPYSAPELVAGQRASIAYQHLLSAAFKNLMALDQLSQGWQIFDNAVKTKLVNGDRKTWTELPSLKA